MNGNSTAGLALENLSMWLCTGMGLVLLRAIKSKACYTRVANIQVRPELGFSGPDWEWDIPCPQQVPSTVTQLTSRREMMPKWGEDKQHPLCAKKWCQQFLEATLLKYLCVLSIVLILLPVYRGTLLRLQTLEWEISSNFWMDSRECRVWRRAGLCGV